MVEKSHQKLLVVDSGLEFAKQLQSTLGRLGIQVDHALRAEELFALWDYQRYDLVILGQSLPDENGLVLLRKLRQRDPVPIFFVTEGGDMEVSLMALEMGADDVFDKPACSQHFKAMTLKLGNFLDRIARLKNPAWSKAQRRWVFADWTLEEETRMLVNNEGEQLKLTRAEFDLLLALVRAESRPLSRMQLSDAVGRGNLDTSPETIAVLIHRLRKKLGCKQVIQTLSGVGYRIQECRLVQ